MKRRHQRPKGMRYFANPGNPKVNKAMSAGLIDCIVTPLQGNRVPEGAWICLDNGCFGQGYPGDDGWWKWVQRQPTVRCRFVVIPDVVGDAAATLERSLPLMAKVRASGRRVAFVAQNGIEHTEIPWHAFDVLFIGGSKECLPCAYVHPITAPRTSTKPRCPHCARVLTEWKLGAIVRSIVALALRHGKEVHMGRVNSKSRVEYAASIGCSSVDGTYIKYGPDINLPRLLGWIHDANKPPSLFDIPDQPPLSVPIPTH